MDSDTLMWIEQLVNDYNAEREEWARALEFCGNPYRAAKIRAEIEKTQNKLESLGETKNACNKRPSRLCN